MRPRSVFRKVSARHCWLESDSPAAKFTGSLWRLRAKAGVALRARGLDQIDFAFAREVAEDIREQRAIRDGTLRLTDDHYRDVERLGEILRSSRDAARDRPWLKAKAIYPMMADTDRCAAALLVASLSIDAPDTKGSR